VLAHKSVRDQLATPLQHSISLITEAMDIVDAEGSYPEVAAHLDLALRGLRERLATIPETDQRK
jgi:hypothetical protein